MYAVRDGAKRRMNRLFVGFVFVEYVREVFRARFSFYVVHHMLNGVFASSKFVRERMCGRFAQSFEFDFDLVEFRLLRGFKHFIEFSEEFGCDC